MRTTGLQFAESEAIHQHQGIFPEGFPAKTEEELRSATLLVGEANMVQGASVVTNSKLQLRHAQVLSALATQPTLVQASVVCVAAVSCLVFAQMGGRGLYDGWYGGPPNLAAIAVGMALIMAASLLGSWLQGRMSEVRQAIMTGILTAFGCGILEWAALRLPITSAINPADTFMRGNLLVLVFAVVVGLSSAWHGWRNAPVPRHPRRLHAAQWGELPA